MQHNAEKDNTYCNFSLQHFSCIDHFILCDNMFECVSSVAVNDLANNFSNHCPIVLNCSITCDRFTEKAEPSDGLRRQVSWQKASDEMLASYKCILNDLLSNYEFDINMLYCNDVHCTDIKHKQAIDKLCNFIIISCIDAGTKTLPIIESTTASHNIPYWKEECEPLRELSLHFHDIWKREGKPQEGPVAEDMRNARTMYHNKVKESKRNKVRQQRRKFAECNQVKNNDKFWREVKKVTNVKNHVINCIDGQSGSADICTLFANKYKYIYSSVPTDNSDH